MWSILSNHLFYMSIIASGLYLLLKLLSAVTNRYFTSAWHYYTYIIMYLFLLLPFQKLLPLFPPSRKLLVENSPVSTLVPVDGGKPIPVSPSQHFIEWQSQIKVESPVFLHVLLYVWLMGVILFLVVAIVQNSRLSRTFLRNTYVVEEPQYIQILASCKRQMGISNDVKLFVSPYTSTPFLYGLIRPRIILPDIKFTAEELKHVLAHELMHWKRRDPWVKCLLLLIQAIHWYNPVTYMARKDIDRFCELSCDESVVKSMNLEERRRYCELMLTVLWNLADRNTGLFSAFSGKKKELERRMKMILKNDGLQSKRWIRMVAVASTLAIALVGTSAAAYATPDKVPQASVQKASADIQQIGSVDNINISPTLEPASTSNQTVQTARYQKAESSLEKVSPSLITPYGTSEPTSFWNLAANNNNGSFTGVSNASGIYTNYYFAPNFNNTIYLDQRVTGQNSSSQIYMVTLYDKDTGSAVSQNTFMVGNTTWTLTYSGLNSNHFYYIHWKAVGDNQYIDGTATVRH